MSLSTKIWGLALAWAVLTACGGSGGKTPEETNNVPILKNPEILQFKTLEWVNVTLNFVFLVVTELTCQSSIVKFSNLAIVSAATLGP